MTVNPLTTPRGTQSFELGSVPGPLRVAVLGLGLIGGSVALGILEQADPEPFACVTGWDPDPQTCQAAAQRGIRIAHSAVAAVADADLVILCGPLQTLAATASEIAPHLRADTIITDVGSVKSAVRQAMIAAGVNEKYVGAHPMAGLEQAGFMASSADLLKGATWALTVDEHTKAKNVVTLLKFVTTVFGARVIVLDDHSHDSAAAIISHVPHVLAHGLLGHAAQSPQAIVAQRLAAGSFRDGTRVARLNPARNQAMIEDNREAVIGSLRLIMADLTTLVADLESGRDSGGFFHRALDWQPPQDFTKQDVLIDSVNWRQELLRLGANGDLVTKAVLNRSETGSAQLTVTVERT